LISIAHIMFLATKMYPGILGSPVGGVILVIELNLHHNDVTSLFFAPNHWTDGNSIPHNGQQILYLCFRESRTPVSTTANSCTTSTTSSSTSLICHSTLQ
jgi:hypothetical protein